MSLFKARDWWSTVLGEKEEFDQGCLCLADVDNSGNGHGEDLWVCFCCPSIGMEFGDSHMPRRLSDAGLSLYLPTGAEH
jgi:hypothetical protein